MQPFIVERFLRVSITLCVAAWLGMLALLIFSVGPWAMWLLGLVACAGVILSFGVHLNHIASPKPTGVAVAG